MQLPYIDLTLYIGKSINEPDVCWICGSDETTVSHHMIPRSYGGEKTSALVWICPNCHKNVHAVEEFAGNTGTLSDREVYDKMLETFFYLDPSDLPKAFLCVKIILTARDTIRGDPNKSVAFNTRLPADVHRRLVALRQVYPKLNQGLLVQEAINQLYFRHFGIKK